MSMAMEAGLASLELAGILSWLMKSTALLLIAAAIAFLVQRRSPGFAAHRVWIWGIAGVVLLPCLSLVLPGWALPVALDGRMAISLRRKAGNTSKLPLTLNSLQQIWMRVHLKCRPIHARRNSANLRMISREAFPAPEGRVWSRTGP